MADDAGSKVPYLQAYGKIKKALDKITTAAVPPRFTQDFLATTLNLPGGGARPVISYPQIEHAFRTLRGPIAHCTLLAEDEVVRLRLSVRDRFRQMEWALSARCNAERFSSRRDSADSGGCGLRRVRRPLRHGRDRSRGTGAPPSDRPLPMTDAAVPYVLYEARLAQREPWTAVDWEFHTATMLDPDDVRERYLAACGRSRQVVDGTDDLGEMSVRPRRDGRHFSLRWVLLHLIEETARHAGHADLLREAIDGAVGE